jgi:hypothetical protein
MTQRAVIGLMHCSNAHLSFDELVGASGHGSIGCGARVLALVMIRLIGSYGL